ncbi:1407_t:CDS:1, partial [Paraglomus occultum]
MPIIHLFQPIRSTPDGTSTVKVVPPDVLDPPDPSALVGLAAVGTSVVPAGVYGGPPDVLDPPDPSALVGLAPVGTNVVPAGVYGGPYVVLV